jgi:hypothetical protein
LILGDVKEKNILQWFLYYSIILSINDSLEKI